MSTRQKTSNDRSNDKDSKIPATTSANALRDKAATNSSPPRGVDPVIRIPFEPDTHSAIEQ